MNLWPDPSALNTIHGCMKVAAQRLRLPFRTQSWRGGNGNWLGTGIGNSIDFQDHRPYLPGDDPRYIDWQAYARSGHYTMKLYREEVSPRVDLILDMSSSMFFDEAKKTRVFELVYFCVESALQSNSSLRCHLVNGESMTPWPLEVVRSHQAPAMDDSEKISTLKLDRVVWRQGSLRVLVSDLLFPGSPEPMLTAMTGGKGKGLILSPFCQKESAPEWEGNTEFVDCETKLQRMQHVPSALLERYATAYIRHFELWKELGRKHSVLVTQVAAEPEFLEAIRMEAVPSGAIELIQ